jgi:hypothetical protein
MAEEKMDRDLTLKSTMPFEVIWREQPDGIHFACNFNQTKETQMVCFTIVAQTFDQVLENDAKKPKKDRMTPTAKSQHIKAAGLCRMIATNIADAVYKEQMKQPDNRIVMPDEATKGLILP